ncbi:MAG: cobalamin B12-binding domain-containing protein, partial [bacterium]|nr:cobalamin B12-binding domain-containing protein [bacterium]
MRVVFVTLYNQCAYGPRCLSANLLRHGHEVFVLNFKLFRSVPIDRADVEHRRRIAANGFLPVYETLAHHDIVCGYPTTVTDTERETLFAEIEKLAPEVLCFSLTSSHVPLAQSLSRECRRRFPRTMQVWGGIHPTMDPTGCLEFADAVCVGEGDEALP